MIDPQSSLFFPCIILCQHPDLEAATTLRLQPATREAKKEEKGLVDHWVPPW